MYALFGWLDYKSIVPYRVLRKLTQALANAAEERGTDAAGISYIHDNKVTIFKRPKPAHKIHFNAPAETKAVMGHTRLATQGDRKQNYNNHPFVGHADKEFAFAHNGVLWNDKELRKDKLIPDTHIETDSYAACQLIESQDKLDFDSLKYMAKQSRATSHSQSLTTTTACISSRAAIPCACSTSRISGCMYTLPLKVS